MAKKSGKSEYVPDRGDIIWVNFNPVSGREQAGSRPAFVVSPAAFNRLSGLAFLCPITSKVKGFSFEVNLGDSGIISGVILIHHLRSIDWKARNIKFVEKAKVEVIEEVLAKLNPLFS